MVEVLAGFAIPSAKITKVLGIDQKTLLKHFAAELERGAAVVEAKLVGNLLRLAGGNDGTALKAIMFALNCRFGWSAYVPRPAEERPLGKKEIAQQEAERMPDSDWGQLLQ